MSPKDISVICPYCGKEFTIPPPGQLGLPHELECVPYTRDIGKFDPPHKTEWFSAAGWSRIGEDFMRILNWERIGILRLERPGINVQYRVQHCPACEYPFDVYANYTEIPLRKLWSHLFGAMPDDPCEIAPYRGKSAEIWLIDRFTKFLHSRVLSAIMIGVLIFSLGILSAIYQNNISLVVKVPVEFFVMLILYGIASIGIVVNLILKDRYIRYLSETADFEKLFRLKKRRGATHWQNFTLSRFVGVQDVGRFPNISQVDVVGGGLAVVTLFIVWLVIKFGWETFSVVMASIFITVLLIIGVRLLIRNKTAAHFVRRIGVVLPPVLMLVLLAFVFFYTRAKTDASFVLHLHLFTDLFFWMVVVYFLGTAVWLAMDSTFYVLEGIKRLPLNLNPFNNFSNAGPLKKLQAYSTGTMVAISLTVLAIIASITVFSQPQFSGELNNAVKEYNWIFVWLQWALTFILIVIGFATTGKPYFILITLFYIVITVLLSGFIVNIWLFRMEGTVIAFGVFFTVVLLYQVLSNKKIITAILRQVKEEAMGEIEEFIDHIQNRLAKLKEHKLNGDRAGKNVFTEQASLIASLNDLLSLHRHVSQVKLQPMTATRWLQLFSPFIMSVFLPGVLNKFFDEFLNWIIK